MAICTIKHNYERVKSGDTSVLEITETCLEKFADNPNNCCINLFPEISLRIAEQVDIKLQNGIEVPLAGTVFGIKDNIHLKDTPSTCGSKMLENYVAPFSATAIDRLMAAGAVPIAKMNMDEFGMGSTNEFSAYGRVENPIKSGRVPGGSSGGAASAVGAHLLPVAIGSDTGGSIRQPAAFCGLVGVKPTYGLVSRYGLVSYGSSFDVIGPITRSVEDAALVTEIISGHDHRDCTSLSESPFLKPASTTHKLAVLDINSLEHADQIHPELISALDNAVQTAEKLGFSVSTIQLPSLQQAVAAYYILVTAEASSNLARFDGLKYGSRAIVDANIEDYRKHARTVGFGIEVKRRIMLGNFILSSGHGDQLYQHANIARCQFKLELDELLEPFDGLLMPVTPTLPGKFGDAFKDPLLMYLQDLFTVPANLCGTPSIALPAGFTNSGFPLSIQLMGSKLSEPKLFQIARAFEAF